MDALGDVVRWLNPGELEDESLPAWLREGVGPLFGLESPDAFNAAMTACSSQLPSRKAIVACLQSSGLQVSEPPAQPFPADAANLAWQNCRSEWMQSSGAPAQILTRYDCMARHGWIMALITGQPADETGYNAASRNC